MTEWRPDVFDYLSYREYMRDYYAAGKEHVDVFSFRYLARRAGFGSPSFIKLVMEGERNLSADGAAKVAVAFELEADDAMYFKALVDFEQAPGVKEKNDAFEHVAAARGYRNARCIDFDMFEYLSRWYYPAVREMVARLDFEEDPEWIAERLMPRVGVEEVSKALEVLERLGLVTRDASGMMVRGEPTVTTGPEVGSLAVGNIHRQMLERAAESIELFPSHVRDISALTLCVSMERVPELKQRLRAFREVLLSLCENEERPERVYQLNMQLFPLNKVEDV